MGLKFDLVIGNSPPERCNKSYCKDDIDPCGVSSQSVYSSSGFHWNRSFSLLEYFVNENLFLHCNFFLLTHKMNSVSKMRRDRIKMIEDHKSQADKDCNLQCGSSVLHGILCVMDNVCSCSIGLCIKYDTRGKSPDDTMWLSLL